MSVRPTGRTWGWRSAPCRPRQHRLRRRRQLAGKNPVKVASGQWHTLRLRLVADAVEVFLNGQSLFTARDTRTSVAGKVAVGTKSDNLTQFGAMTVTTLP